jgi:hypothetical protein
MRQAAFEFPPNGGFGAVRPPRRSIEREDHVAEHDRPWGHRRLARREAEHIGGLVLLAPAAIQSANCAVPHHQDRKLAFPHRQAAEKSPSSLSQRRSGRCRAPVQHPNCNEIRRATSTSRSKHRRRMLASLQACLPTFGSPYWTPLTLLTGLSPSPGRALPGEALGYSGRAW